VHSRADAQHVGSRFALTFDDGPDVQGTPQILDALSELGISATFFVIGRHAIEHPNLVARIHAEGHVLANHSFDHPYFGLFRGREYWRRQIGLTDDTIEQVIGRRPAMFRPPVGIKTWFNCGTARALGHSVVTWSRRAMDGVATSPQRILKRLACQTVAGDILLLHDGADPRIRRDPKATVGAIRPLIQQLRDRGLEAAPLHELLQVPAYAPAARPTRPAGQRPVRLSEDAPQAG
jgi:peptidoglycan/xylan/chitin deacetylase (PgdA/CDA1 family)